MKPKLSFIAKNDKTEAVVIWEHHETIRLSVKDNNAGKTGKKQEQRKIKYEGYSLPKSTHWLEFARVEQDC